jgi:hypothetical protein
LLRFSEKLDGQGGSVTVALGTADAGETMSHTVTGTTGVSTYTATFTVSAQRARLPHGAPCTTRVWMMVPPALTCHAATKVPRGCPPFLCDAAAQTAVAVVKADGTECAVAVRRITYATPANPVPSLQATFANVYNLFVGFPWSWSIAAAPPTYFTDGVTPDELLTYERECQPLACSHPCWHAHSTLQ